MNRKASGNRKATPGGSEGRLRVGGILKGLADLLEKLDELAESGAVSRTGEIRGAGQEVKGIYGYTVKVGLGEDQVKVEPFGNIRKDSKSGRTVVQDVREPVVDVFEEPDHVLVVAEMPGISPADVRLEVEGDVLTIAAERDDKKYSKEVLLPESFPRERMRVSGHNGVVEIKCVRAH